MDWEDFQIEVVDPTFGECTDPALTPPACGPAGQVPWLKVVANAGDAHSSGIEAHLEWIPADGWNVGANAQWLERETDEPLVLDTRDSSTKLPCAPADLGVTCGNVLAKGRQLPNFPEFSNCRPFARPRTPSRTSNITRAVHYRTVDKRVALSSQLLRRELSAARQW